MAVFDAVYGVSAPDRDELMHPPSAVFNELVVASVLAPRAASNMRAASLPGLWCLDASPPKGAICHAPLPPAAGRALWRHGERKWSIGAWRRAPVHSSA